LVKARRETAAAVEGVAEVVVPVLEEEPLVVETELVTGSEFAVVVMPDCVLVIAPVVVPVVVPVPEVVVDAVEPELEVVTGAPIEKEGVEAKTWLILEIATNSTV